MAHPARGAGAAGCRRPRRGGRRRPARRARAIPTQLPCAQPSGSRPRPRSSIRAPAAPRPAWSRCAR
ncbi:hypothetical protein DEJ27_06055 [Curtobacterium sp. MCPF17_018]|nr:hypothetical protein DEJ27_06055 [Curtobacterium sp. MCPF17_018]PZF33781.1 hypothetical protein DEJ35_02680 [Curtobacterium sp. MCPF17_051]